MALFGLFKSSSQREKERLATEAKLTRAHDMGRRTAQTVIPIIDTFFDEKLLPVAKNIIQAYDDAMECHHHDPSTDEAMQIFLEFEPQLQELKKRALEGVWDVLGEWKYTLIEAGLKDDFEHYIAQKFDPVWEEMSKNASTQMAYCAARISGHITDEMHAMTPDELKDYMAKRDKK